MCLEAAKIDFTSACCADERFWKYEAEYCKCTEHFQRSQTFVRVERCPFDRVEDIQRNRVDVELFQMECHFHTLVEVFAQSDDAARAYADACLLRCLDDVFLIFHRVRGADFREIRR